jgi:hypothetical protein
MQGVRSYDHGVGDVAMIGSSGVVLTAYPVIAAALEGKTEGTLPLPSAVCPCLNRERSCR